MQRINDATENLRSSLKRLYKPELPKQCGVDEDKLKNFMDGAYLSDEDKELLTNHMFPHLVYDAARDRFVSRTVTHAIMQATAYLRRLTQDYRDKPELARRTGINNLAILEAFAAGDKDLTVAQKQDLARIFDLHNRQYDARTDSLAPLPATRSFITPPEYVPRHWRDQQVPTLTTVDAPS